MYKTFLNYILFLGARHIGFVSQKTEIIKSRFPVKFLSQLGNYELMYFAKNVDKITAIDEG